MTPSRLMAISAVALAVFALLLVSACGSASTVSIGHSQNGKTISLHEGDKLIVSLESHANAGCNWKLQFVNRAVLKPMGSEFLSEKQAPGGAGTAGLYVFDFEAAVSGETALRLSCVRTLDSRPTASFRVRVFVK